MTTTDINNPQYRWPDLSPVIRQHVVKDDLGRIGIAYSDNVYHVGVLFAHPADVPSQIDTGKAILMTNTAFHVQLDGTYTGIWYDYDGPTSPATIPTESMRRITIMDDLGYKMPDKFAAGFLGGSDKGGYWDSFYARGLGRKGGSATSPAKQAASRANGRLGGRPRKAASSE
jgi:hypothetical protein